MGRFRKKPVEIEARQVPVYNENEPVTPYLDESIALAEWCGGTSFMMGGYRDDDDDYRIEIPTLEGTMKASPGDWIIKGVQGEFYPCKPDIFEQTYEKAD